VSPLPRWYLLAGICWRDAVSLLQFYALLLIACSDSPPPAADRYLTCPALILSGLIWARSSILISFLGIKQLEISPA